MCDLGFLFVHFLLSIRCASLELSASAYLDSSAPLFLRKLVLGIPAQASGKNHVAINAFGAPIRPAFVSLRHIIASSMLTP